jgi:hypothetical protein
MATARSTSFAIARSLIDDVYEDECYDFVYGLDAEFFNGASLARTDLLRSLLGLSRNARQMPSPSLLHPTYYYDWDVPGFLTYGSAGW